MFLSEPQFSGRIDRKQNKIGKVIDREEQARVFNPNITCDITGKSFVVQLDYVLNTTVADRSRNDSQGFLHLWEALVLQQVQVTNTEIRRRFS